MLVTRWGKSLDPRGVDSVDRVLTLQQLDMSEEADDASFSLSAQSVICSSVSTGGCPITDPGVNFA